MLKIPEPNKGVENQINRSQLLRFIKVSSLAGRVSSADTRRCPPADAGGMGGARVNGREGGR